MIKFVTTRDGKRKCVVYSNTPPKTGIFFDLNRRQRRGLVYARPVAQLITKIDKLTLELRKAGCPGNWIPTRPDRNSRKVLSGYMSVLRQFAINFAAHQENEDKLNKEGW